MATNFYKPGSIWEKAAPTGGYTSGTAYAIVTGSAGFIGVALNTVAATETGQLQIDGIWTLPATAGTGLTFADGDLLYWDASAGKLTKTATGNTRAGRAYGAKTAAGTTAKVLLNGI